MFPIIIIIIIIISFYIGKEYFSLKVYNHFLTHGILKLKNEAGILKYRRMENSKCIPPNSHFKIRKISFFPFWVLFW
jgi:hypothetical protein